MTEQEVRDIIRDEFKKLVAEQQRVHERARQRAEAERQEAEDPDWDENCVNVSADAVLEGYTDNPEYDGYTAIPLYAMHDAAPQPQPAHPNVMHHPGLIMQKQDQSGEADDGRGDGMSTRPKSGSPSVAPSPDLTPEPVSEMPLPYGRRHDDDPRLTPAPGSEAAQDADDPIALFLKYLNAPSQSHEIFCIEYSLAMKVAAAIRALPGSGA